MKQTERDATAAVPKNKGGRPRNPAIHANVVLEARRAQKLSRAKVARAMTELGCPISEEAIASWEEGRYTPPTSRLAALCAVLNLKVTEVLVLGPDARSIAEAHP